ncbi:MAG TPA: hypothetical protein VIF09_13500 [Polyangiaceae bacterium]
MRWSTQTWFGGCCAVALTACSTGVADAPPWEGDGGAEAASGDPGGGDDGGGGGQGTRAGDADASAAIATACEAAGQALCARTSACSQFLFQLRETDVASCATRYALQCEAALGAPGANETPGFIEACSAATAGGSCNDLFDGVVPHDCQSPQAGALADGSACGESTQCASLDCRKPTGSYCGTCVTPAQAGKSCASADCAAGLQCMSDSVCRALAAQGASCSATQHCQFPLVCKSGTCSTPEGLGASCSSTSSTCDSTIGLVCDPQTQKCVAATLVSPGYACGVVSGKPMTCSSGALCKFPSSSSATGKCVAAAADGASCNVTTGPSCEGPAYCNGGVCRMPDPAACK